MLDPIPTGSHLVSQRRVVGLPLYTHHGIYTGDDKVIHYAGNSGDPAADGQKVQIVGLDRFHGGLGYWVVPHGHTRYSPDDVVARARSRLAEDGYSVFSNNCEHFCNWVVDGDHLSQQVDLGALATGTTSGAIGAIVGGIAIPGAAAAATGLAGGAAMMKGLAVVGAVTGGAIGGLATAGGALGLASALAINKTLLADAEVHTEDEAEARKIGRAASYTGAVGAAAGTVATVSAAGAVSGLSAAGITSGLAAVGGTVGGGMAAGIAIGVAAPAVVAVGAGYGAYKLAQNNETVRDGLIKAGDVVGDAAKKGADIAGQAVNVAAPVVADAASAVGELAKKGLLSLLGSVEAGAAALKKKLDGGEQA